MKTRLEFHKLINRLDYKIAAEIGTYRGEFAEYLLEETDLELLYVIDPWTFQSSEEYEDAANHSQSMHDHYYQECMKRLRRFKDRLGVRKEFSPQAAEQFDDRTFDFVYIDGNHSYKTVKADLEAWYPKVRPGGMLAGHDYVGDGFHHNCHFGVAGAVDEFVERLGVKLHTTQREEHWASWYFIV